MRDEGVGGSHCCVINSLSTLIHCLLVVWVVQFILGASVGLTPPSSYLRPASVRSLIPSSIPSLLAPQLPTLGVTSYAIFSFARFK